MNLLRHQQRLIDAPDRAQDVLPEGVGQIGGVGLEARLRFGPRLCQLAENGRPQQGNPGLIYFADDAAPESVLESEAIRGRFEGARPHDARYPQGARDGAVGIRPRDSPYSTVSSPGSGS